MAQTHTGAKQAAQTIRAKRGANWFAEIGALGGKAGNTGGFAGKPELARRASRKGIAVRRLKRLMKVEDV